MPLERRSIRIYIPEPQTQGKPWLNEALFLLSEQLGGATAYFAIGSWLEATGLVTEPVVVVESCELEPDTLTAALPAIYQFCQKMKAEMHQESVLYTLQPCEAVLV